MTEKMVNLLTILLKQLLEGLFLIKFVPTEVGYINEILTKKSLRDIIGKVLKNLPVQQKQLNSLMILRILDSILLSKAVCHSTSTMLSYLKKKTNSLQKVMSRLKKC
jgi:hypothetical protein